MKNNKRGLLIHIVVIIILFLFTALINTSDLMTRILYGNRILRSIIAIIPLILYYNFANAMSKKQLKRLDFLAGNIIVLFTIILIIPPILFLNKSAFSGEVSSTMWRFPLDLFLMPEIYMYKLLGIRYNLISALLAGFIPGIIYGISIKRNRAKIIRRIKIQNAKNMKKARNLEMRRTRR